MPIANRWRMFWRIFRAFFKIGAFTIGGGYAMLPLIEREVVEKQKWVTHEEIIDVFAIVQSVPGVIAINSSIFIGYKTMGMFGAIAAALGVILPSFVVIIPIAYLMFNLQGNVYVEKALSGVRAGVTAMIALTAVKLAKSTLKGRLDIFLAVASFAAMAFFDVHAILAITVGALIGLLAYGIKRREKK